MAGKQSAAGRGGHRGGAGRKPQGGERMVTIHVTLPNDLIVIARALGDGNASKGVRVALRLAQAGDVVLVPKIVANIE
jgi:hypothetical protein